MAHVRRALSAVAVLIALATAGCTAAAEVATTAPGLSPTPAAAPTPAPAVAGSDLRGLLVDPAEIPLPGFLPPAARPLAEDAVDGLVASYDSTEGELQLGVTIVLLPDPAAAQEAVLGAVAATREQRTGASSAPAQVGDRAVVFTGYELAGTASTLLLFSQGRASVAMDFRSPSTDPIPTEAVLATGTRQAARLAATAG